MLFLQQMDPETTIYNVGFSIRLQAPLDEMHVRQALQLIVDRHAPLRTKFSVVNGAPQQMILPQQTIAFEVVNAAGWSEEQIKQAVDHFYYRPFDLAVDNVFRSRLYQLSETRFVLQVVVHHIAIDAWSIWLLVDEFRKNLAALRAGDAPILKSLRYQYSDFVQWQKDLLADERGQAMADFWQEELTGVSVLDLPGKKVQSSEEPIAYDLIRFEIEPELARRVRDLSFSEGTTTYSLLLAAFLTLLWKYSGEQDVAVGTPGHGRGSSRFAALIGYFVNLMVMRERIDPDVSFRTFLGEVGEKVQTVLLNQHYPFALAANQKRPSPDNASQGVVQAMFNLIKLPRKLKELAAVWLDESRTAQTEMDGVTISRLEVESGYGIKGIDLYLEIIDFKERMIAKLGYNQVFEPEMIARMAAHFQQLLKQIVQNPDLPLRQLSMLTPAERQDILHTWNDTAVPLPSDQFIHTLFARQADQIPAETAVLFNERSLTYRELNQQANQLAHHLRRHGIGPDDLVGICMERSLDMVISVLAVLKAGGAYVPLDPAYPAERLAQIIQDARPALLLSHEPIVAALFTKPESPVARLSYKPTYLRLDTERPSIAAEPTENPANICQPENLAYVIYTSGSTGRPKGVALPHRALSNLINWQLQQSPAASDFAPKRTLMNANDADSRRKKSVKSAKSAVFPIGERTLQFASLNFDVSCQEMFAAWGAGGTLLLVGEDVRHDAASLLHYIADNNVNRLFLPYVALQQIAEAAGFYHIYPSSLHEIITAGEQLRIDPAVSRFFRALPHCTLVNQYGPTESHVVAAYKLEGDVSTWPLLPPIGRPIANTQIYLLDQQRQPVPVGLVGELYIGGHNLARGYFNNPELTSERFVDNPFGGDAPTAENARLYKTGDLARYLPDGNIEFLGRVDRQVKIRGFRIELGEIEAVLGQYAGVRATAVTSHTGENGHKRLIAYIVPAEDPAPTAADLRRFLQQKLPDYMIPAAFVTMAEMPLLPNGKINRRALPPPDAAIPDLQEQYVAPRTPQEKIVAAIWEQVLQVERVGIHDNYFELGGHSLLATQIVSRIREAARVELPIRTLFDMPTVAQLAEKITLLQDRETAVPATPLAPTAYDGPLPLSFSQNRMWFLHQLDPESTAYNIPGAVHLHGALNKEALAWSVNQLIIRHESLRTRFTAVNGQPNAIIEPAYAFALSTEDCRAVPASERLAYAGDRLKEAARTPFKLDQLPLFQIKLFQLDDEDHILLVNMHHIISDQWSLGVLSRDLTAYYRAYVTGGEADLPEMPIQAKDHAVWQRQLAADGVFDEQMAYWRKQLEALTPFDLPSDRPRRNMQSTKGAILDAPLPDWLTDALSELSRQERVTPYMVLLAAFKLLLFHYTGAADIVVGSPIANRHQLQSEALISTLVNTLVLRTDLSGNPTFRQLLRRVQRTALAAYDHQDVPFEKLVDALLPRRDTSRSPFFQVFFNVQNAPFSLPGLPGVKSEIMEIDRGAAQFDLSLSIDTALTHKAVIEYNTDLFDAGRVERMMGHYWTLLETAVTQPDTHLSDLPLLTEAEKKQLAAWNETAMPYPHGDCLHQLFAAQVQRTPEAAAVTFQSQSLTYRQLDQLSNQLARHLQTLGVGPETVVGIFVERSLEMVVGLLGVLKAGGAYLPLDPAFPADRLAFMVEDAQVDVILTQNSLVDVDPAAGVPHPVCLDSDWLQIAQYPADPLPPAAKPENRAYIIYTSGSTGKPKGVQIEHRNAVNFLTAMQQKPGIKPDDILYSVTTLSFDISVLEIFLPLLNGAQVVIADALTVADGRAIINDLRRYQATVMQATPTTWSMMVDAGWQGTSSLRLALCGGEALSRELANAVLERGADLWNMYGPTETTVWSSVQQVLPGSGQIPIGRPIGNTFLYILDGYGRAAPIGVAGELYIGGDGVARGYLNRPELNADRFLPNPFADGRMYRTGDLARFLPDGVVEYLGRTDFQVKIHGHRIELGEIESLLAAHPCARETAVTVHGQSGNQILAAYIVPHKEVERPTITALRDYLRQHLPEYMIPSAFVFLDEFPLTPNRKINRKALPAPDTYRPDLDNQYVAPRNDVEWVLTTIMADLLDIEKVGVHDDFFELGGHSLQATRFVARVGQAFRMDLPLWTFLRAPNAADLAQNLANAPDGQRIAKIAKLRAKMAGMSPEEVQQLLRQRAQV